MTASSSRVLSCRIGNTCSPLILLVRKRNWQSTDCRTEMRIWPVPDRRLCVIDNPPIEKFGLIFSYFGTKRRLLLRRHGLLFLRKKLLKWLAVKNRLEYCQFPVLESMNIVNIWMLFFRRLRVRPTTFQLTAGWRRDGSFPICFHSPKADGKYPPRK